MNQEQIEKIKKLDAAGVRPFVGHSETGTFRVEVFRKKLPSEDGKMWKREGHIQTYMTREEATEKAIELAESVFV